LSSSASPKRRYQPLVLLVIGTLLIATTCSLYFLSQTTPAVSEPQPSESQFLERNLAASPYCANGKYAYATGLTVAQKAEVLKAHNTFRSTIALGKAPGQPGATDMLEMVWDEQVATRAQAWADQCIFQHDTSSNRQPTKFSYVGQNLVYTGYSSSKTQASMTALVQRFYDEVKLYGGRAGPVSGYSFNAQTGHYTQLAWAGSYTIGCGFKKYYDGGFYVNLLVCNYGPGGNYLSQKMYTKGTFNAKLCKKGASTTYPGLCKA